MVCSECGHVSVTYEPFMYLSLPIPHAMEQQICKFYKIAVHSDKQLKELQNHQEKQTINVYD